MHSCLEKPIIREKRAETSAAAVMKFAFQLTEAISEKSKSGFSKRKS